MKKFWVAVVSFCMMVAMVIGLAACQEDEPQEATFEKFAKDWYAYKMTTVTDGVESDGYGNFDTSSDFVRFWLKSNKISDAYQGWFQERIANPDYEQGVNKQYLIDFQGIDFTWKLDGETATFHVQGTAVASSEQTAINSDFTAKLSGTDLIVEQLLPDNQTLNRYYCKASK